MSKRAGVQEICRLFRVLSDETRLRLLLSLEGGEKHVTELCKTLRLPQPTVSHHLGLLRIHGLVRNRRKGKLVYYSIEPSMHARWGRSLKALMR